MKSAPLAALLCVLTAPAAWAVDAAPRTTEEQKTDELNKEQLDKAQGGAQEPAPIRAFGTDGKPLSAEAYANLPPEARWAMEQIDPKTGEPKYIKAHISPDGTVLGYETKNSCDLPNGVAAEYALAHGMNQPPPTGVTAPGAADESQLGATARRGDETTGEGRDAGGKPTDAGAEDPGVAAAPKPPTDTAAPNYIAAMGDFLYNQNNPPPGTPSYDSAAAFDGPGGDSGSSGSSSSGGSPNVVSDDGAAPTGGQSGAIAYGSGNSGNSGDSGDSGGPKGSDLGGAEVKCKTKAECEAVAASYKAAADGAALGFAAGRPAEGIRSIAQTAQSFKPQAIMGDVLSGSSGQAALEGGAGEDQLKEDSGRPFVGNGRVLDPAKFCSKDSKVYEALGTAGKEVKKRC